MQYKNYRVLAIGDNIVDKYEKDNYISAGGNALNFAIYSKMLGAHSSYIGVFGTDKNAKFIKNIIDSANIDRTHSKIIEGENGYVSIEMVDNERHFLYGNSGGVGKNLILDNADLEYIKSFDIINTNIISHFDVEKELKKIYSVNKNIAFDFSIRFDNENFYKYAPFIKYALISTSHISKNENEILLKNIALNFPNIDIIISTRAEQGSIIFNNNKMYYANAYRDIKYKDSLGAGDAYLSSFLYYHIAKNVDIENAMSKASKFAANICELAGAFGDYPLVRDFIPPFN